MSTEHGVGRRIASEWLALGFITTLVGLAALSMAFFNRDFSSDETVTNTDSLQGWRLGERKY